ncbi:hypothetical protein [Paracoccus mutanolyticus]|uniref:hypothetical protein n=1 Tax=Paracoccus mutanolyticus TaxID=1499308 RepID=UPI001CB955CD|nr:hypothetical protein [Paracoccus mutanolyticus]
MIATSTIVMFGLMYLNTYAWDHIHYSQTRTWMAVVMGAVMAIIMLSFMWGMYKNRGLNIAGLSSGRRTRPGWCAARRPSTTSAT